MPAAKTKQSIKPDGKTLDSELTREQVRIVTARHHDPFAVLGYYQSAEQSIIRAFVPAAARVGIISAEEELSMERLGTTDLFQWQGAPDVVVPPYRLCSYDHRGAYRAWYDPYSFSPQIADFDLHLFHQGRHRHAYRFLGANARTVNGIDGMLFATWAPNAERVSVVGDFNHWDGRCHPMRCRGDSGIWELFIPGLGAGELYKYELVSRQGGNCLLRADPYGRRCQAAPETASVTTAVSSYQWRDQSWLHARQGTHWQAEPVSIYEVHPGSWRRKPDGRYLGYRELADQLAPYVRSLGFSHIELMPVTEHPFDGSWGYQSLGYFAPTGRFGDADDLRYLIDCCHQHGLGVILDWVPAHFPRDEHGLARFDGSPLYEHDDPRRGEHPDWDTLIFNYGRNEVRNFLVASAMYWLEEFHFDGLRVDAVSSMLYLDYSREDGNWLPNIHGGRENLEAIAFLQELNSVLHEEHPGTLVLAEESTAWPSITQPVHLGGLGFSMKWNMGWMNDTLSYMRRDPVHRSFHHDQLTFSMVYAFAERFVLPLSHDEVVHGKGSLLAKMPGDDWQRFANLRLLLTYQFTHPGKKLLFMGSELASWNEWDHDRELDWYLLEVPAHAGIKQLVTDLNGTYRHHPALHRYDADWRGFQWIDCHDHEQSVLSFLRRCDGETIVVVLNFTPVVHHNYRIGVPHAGFYREVFNSDAACYGGSNVGNRGGVEADPLPWMAWENSLNLTLPPLAGLVFTLPNF